MTFMHRQNRYLVALMAVLLLAACKEDEPAPFTPDPLDEQLVQVLTDVSQGVGPDLFLLPAPEALGSIPQDPRNPLTPEKVALGKLLFHETGLALTPKNPMGAGTYSCASCHFASAGFQAGRHQGIGEGGQGFGVNGEGRHRDANFSVIELDVQPIRSPSALNSAFLIVTLWNGQFGAKGPNEGTEYAWVPGSKPEVNHLGFHGLESQAIEGLGIHRLVTDRETLENLGYKEMFDQAFPGLPQEERYSRITAGLAIAAYERTLMANEAPFQQWLRGEKQALSSLEKEGAILFFGKGQCGSCHSGPALNSMEFYALGMNDMFDCPEETFQTPVDAPTDLGRGGFTGRPEDVYKFKVPQLYNLKDSPFYGHGASFRSVRDVVVYKNNAQPENPDVPASQLAEEFSPLGLSDPEIEAITAFLENALHDPNLKRYEPESILSGLCFPNNDPQSRVDLGCE